MIAIVTTTWEVLTQRQWEPFGAVAGGCHACSWMYLFVNIVKMLSCYEFLCLDIKCYTY